MSAYLDVNHSGATYRVLLKRAPAARRFTLRIRAATRDVTLTMPRRGAVADARDFAQRHAAWIGARLSRLPSPVPFMHGENIPFRGESHRIVHRPGLRGTVWIETGSPCEIDSNMKLICVAGSSEHVARRVSDFLKQSAKQDLEAAVRKHATAIGKKPLRVTLRDTSSRWGSCSASGNLNFSWRLILAPPYVLDYLAAHEVGHLVHLNHSARFWKLVNSICLETARAEAWLGAHGSSLHRYGKLADPLDGGDS
jgi:predicted metal-dependent hydrolase